MSGRGRESPEDLLREGKREPGNEHQSIEGRVKKEGKGRRLSPKET